MFRVTALGITIDRDNFLTEESNLIHSRFVYALVLSKINDKKKMLVRGGQERGWFYK